jgi:hypothetical protein
LRPDLVSVGCAAEDQDRDSPCAQVLLLRDVLIHGNEHVEAGGLGRSSRHPFFKPPSPASCAVWQSLPANEYRSRSSTHSSMRSLMKRGLAATAWLLQGPQEPTRGERLETPPENLRGYPLLRDTQRASGQARASLGKPANRALFLGLCKSLLPRLYCASTRREAHLRRTPVPPECPPFDFVAMSGCIARNQFL